MRPPRVVSHRGAAAPLGRGGWRRPGRSSSALFRIFPFSRQGAPPLPVPLPTALRGAPTGPDCSHPRCAAHRTSAVLSFPAARVCAGAPAGPARPKRWGAPSGPACPAGRVSPVSPIPPVCRARPVPPAYGCCGLQSPFPRRPKFPCHTHPRGPLRWCRRSFRRR